MSAAAAELSAEPVRFGILDGPTVGDVVETPLVSEAVRRAQLGDREALGFLYARYADNIHGYVRSIVHDPHEAEDVTRQVFAKLMHVIGKYEERDVPFFAWVLRVARNVAVEHLRRYRMVPVEEVRTSDGGSADPATGGPDQRTQRRPADAARGPARGARPPA